MLNEQQIQAAMGVARRMYPLLLEVMEITDDLSDSLSRQDQVSMRMFLSMRQDSINQLVKCKEELRKQCSLMEPEAGEELRQILAGNPPKNVPGISQLAEQVEKNQALLRRVVQSDRVISQRIGGKQSFYSKP